VKAYGQARNVRLPVALTTRARPHPPRCPSRVRSCRHRLRPIPPWCGGIAFGIVSVPSSVNILVRNPVSRVVLSKWRTSGRRNKPGAVFFPHAPSIRERRALLPDGECRGSPVDRHSVAGDQIVNIGTIALPSALFERLLRA
jgi:hypothetical protein